MKVVLDGHEYSLKSDTGVTRQPIVEWPQNTRLDGQQLRKDRSLISSWSIDNWSGGLGIKTRNEELANHKYRVWDAENVDTRWLSSLFLSPAFVTCTIAPSRGDLDIHFNCLNELYFMETQRQGYTGSLAGGYINKFTPPDIIGSLAALGDFASGSLYTISNVHSIISNDSRIAFTSTGTGTNIFWLWSIGTFGQVPSLAYIITTGSPNIPPYPRVINVGGTLQYLIYSANLVQFGIADRAVSTLSLVGTLASVVGSYLSPLETDGQSVYANLPDGVYDFDATPAKIVDSQRSIDLNCQQTIFHNQLYFKNKQSLLKYDGTDITSVGYDREDGLPDDKQGEITAMTSTWKNIFAAVKGSPYSHILTYDGVWQYYAAIPSPNLWVRDMFLSNSPDGIDRLWCLYGNYAKPGYFLNPLINPIQAATYSFVPTGDVTFPEFNGGMPEEPGAFYNLILKDNGAIGTAFIQVFYGLNGAAPETELGILSSSLETFTFGSPYGVEAYSIQPKFLIRSSLTGTSPQFKNAVIHYLKIPSTRQQFDFTIDIDKTAREIGQPADAIVATLNAIRDKKTLIPFYYGLVGTKNIKILTIPSAEDITEDEYTLGGQRHGYTQMKVGEII